MVGLAFGLGLTIGLIVVLMFRRSPDLQGIQQTLLEIQRRWEEWQQRIATQEQARDIDRSLQEARQGLARVETHLQNAQQSIYPSISSHFTTVRESLSKLQEALDGIRPDLATKHQEYMQNWAMAQQALTALTTSLEGLLNRYQTSEASLSQITESIGLVRQVVDQIGQRVQTLTTIEEIIRRLDSEMGRLVGRRGLVGEAAIEALLSPLPETILKRRVKMGSGEVEFALQLPGGKLVPIDSKVLQTDIVKKTQEPKKDDGSGDHPDTSKKVQELQEKLEQVEKEWAELMREWKKLTGGVMREFKKAADDIEKRYLSDPQAVGLAIMPVPDPVYAEARFSVADPVSSKVVVVPYSLLLPYLLSLYLIAERVGLAQMVTDWKGAIAQALHCLGQAKEKLEDMSRSIKAVENRKNEAADLLGRAVSILTVTNTPLAGHPGKTSVSSDGDTG